MAFKDKIMTSLFGRRFGLQNMSTVQTGGSRGDLEFLVGPEALRQGASTAETTSTNLSAAGISVAPGTSAASSAVYTLDPPIPGVKKTIMGGTANGLVYIKTANSETIISTLGSTNTTVKVSSIGGSFELMGLTTAIWLGLGLTSGTSSQASGFGLTTST
jgi:hypothetical protein